MKRTPGKRIPVKKHFFKRLLGILIVAVVSLGTGNCFQILNYLHFHSDGSLDVTWRFTVSKSMAKASESSGEGQKEDFEAQMEKGRKELQRQLEGRVKNLAVDVISTEFDSGMMIRFKVPDIKNMPDLTSSVGDDELPAFPVYDPKTHTLRVTFENDKDETGPASENALANPTGDDGTETEGMDQDSGAGNEEMGKELAQMILSSARYQVFISGQVPIKATARGNEETDVEIVNLGNSYLIDYPFMSSVVSQNRDIDLVIELKK
tara:strand:+ start:112576 stop:113367 length:792 start_codon:yes stop_codon:yes gene_type:complete